MRLTTQKKKKTKFQNETEIQHDDFFIHFRLHYSHQFDRKRFMAEECQSSNIYIYTYIHTHGKKREIYK